MNCKNESAARYKRFRVPFQRADGLWITSDLYGAAFFASRGNEIVGVEPSGQGGRASFVICARHDFVSVYLAKQKLKGL